MRRHYVWTVTISILAFVTCSLSVIPARVPIASAAGSTPTPGPNSGIIAFSVTRGQNSNIYLVHADGSGLSALTSGSDHNELPAFSPDGTRIAFSSDRDGDLEIYVLPLGGGDLTQLTDNDAIDGEVVWSPDSKQIAFSSDRDGVLDIYVMNADGTEQTRLTNTSSSNFEKKGVSVFPAWSPDGKQIAFASNREGKAALYMMAVVGGNPKKFPGQQGNNVTPAWSPDGKKIAFASDRGGKLDLYLMNVDGSQVTRLTRTDGDNAYPAWSPDGRQIAFMSTRSKKPEIHVISVDSSNGSSKRISKAGSLGAYPAWGPNTLTITLPLPASGQGSAACSISTDKTYGYTVDNPIPVGGGDFGGPARERAYLDRLRGPEGQEITYDRTGSLPSEKDPSVILDAYDITYAGLKKPITLYLNEYSEENPKIPVGFTCAQ